MEAHNEHKDNCKYYDQYDRKEQFVAFVYFGVGECGTLNITVHGEHYYRTDDTPQAEEYKEASA